MRKLSLGVSGIHGEIGAGLSPAHAINYASALGTYLEGATIMVGIDTRGSSQMLKHAICSGLMSCGSNIIDAGLCPSALLSYFCKHSDCQAAINISGIHHPMNFNAIQVIDKDGSPYSPVQGQSVMDIYHGQKFRNISWQETGKMSLVDDSLKVAYLDSICAHLDMDAIRAAKFSIVVDFCNGAGSVLADSFAERFGLNMIAINNTADEFLPHDPEPRPRSSMQVKALMDPLSASIGFNFNSDMSRCAVVSCCGETLSEEFTFPLVADRVLERHGSDSIVVTNNCTTRTLDQIVERHGAKLVKTKTGPSHVIDKQEELKAVLCGEGSGSVAYAPHLSAFDGYFTMGIILESMAVRKKSSSELVQMLDRQYKICKRKMPCAASEAYSIIRKMRDQLDGEIDETDGIRFDWDEGWIHIRPSSTEPVVRIFVEWQGDGAAT
ncbi:MAG: hypothetical protein HRT89_08320, partial [Lentisphaeria bacterium]|nr:hypothetical protein [Lentisphaeria bacterium]NQZ68060.1 hypothetical protein [Lentisphaeria bacterium]